MVAGSEQRNALEKMKECPTFHCFEKCFHCVSEVLKESKKLCQNIFSASVIYLFTTFV